MQISIHGTRTINKGAAENFTGDVQIEPYHQAQEPSRVLASSVTFSPGARTAWHTHPLGQLLIVTEGLGFVQSWGEPAKIIRPGDVVWTAPGVKHWHGAAPNSKMAHTAILESLDGKAADWREHLSDADYRTACSCCEITQHDLAQVSPALAKYEKETISKLWSRSELSARDRSIVTLSALIAKNQFSEMPLYISFALDNGVKPGEVSEIITHLAFYSGWPNAMAAASAASRVFTQRNISVDELPTASPQLLPLNEAAESARASNVEQQFGAVAPGVVQYTTDVLFRDLWLRPGLEPRDRSLVTVSALIASGQVTQITYHLNRAMDNGLTKEQASEVLTHLAFYAGWPNVFSAMPVAKDVFEKRPK